MPLLKNGTLAADPWHKIVNGEPLPPDGSVILPFERWRAERESLLGRNTPLGVRLSNTHSVAELEPVLDRLEVIVLEFPKFTDGRAYSQARLLRERFGYRGELRATGHVLRDQLLHMNRAGFDAFEIARDDAAEVFAKALASLSVFYQPTGDGRVTARDLRLRNLFGKEAAE